MTHNSKFAIHHSEFCFTPIGHVVRAGDPRGLSIPDVQAQRTKIIIAPRYEDGLLGIESGSDLVVLYYCARYCARYRACARYCARYRPPAPATRPL